MSTDYRVALQARGRRPVCAQVSREHADALKIIEYLVDRNGTVDQTQEGIAADLGFWRIYNGGRLREVDMKRFHRARNHARDRTDANGSPCCGFTLNYRRSGKASVLALVDPSGELMDHAHAAVATIRGWVSRERQHHTENTRMVETLEQLGDHALARADKYGYRLIQKAILEIDRDGTITPPTMHELESWLEGLAA